MKMKNTQLTRVLKSVLRISVLGLAILFGQSQSIYAQWATNGNNINNTNSGNVGIGTTGPNRKLTVNNTAAQPEEIIGIYRPASADTSAGRSPVSFEFRGDAYSQNPQLYGWSMFPNTVMAKIGAVPQSFSEVGSGISGTHASLGFFVSSAGHGGLLERMTIVGNGNVGIGITAPALPLDIRKNAFVFSSDARALIGLYDQTAMAQGVGGGIQFGGKFDTGGTTAGFASISGIKENGTSGNFSSALVFTTRTNPNNQIERLRITSAGFVGIGISSPLYSLDVNGGVNSFRAKAATTSSSDAIATFENSSAIQMIVRGNGNVGIGTVNPSNKLHVAGSITVDGNINAKYQDVAEWVESSQELSPGTVVVLDSSRSNQVVAATQAYDSRVAGVISLQPGITLGERGEGRVLVATTGRVKLKVDATNGPIQIGDLLVTSDREGYAMKSLPIDVGGVRIHRPGTIIGKALESLPSGRGEIPVLLSLQ